MKLKTEISSETLQDLIYLFNGLYYPLNGFMTSLDYHNVIDNMRLSNNSVWTIPISLDVNHNIFIKAVDSDRLYFTFNSNEIGYIAIEDCYKVDAKRDVKKIFKTDDRKHPGVKKELNRFQYRIGGKIIVTDDSIMQGALNPERVKDVFARRGWKTIVGFQTRNPIHRAHEHLQRFGLDLCDGLFINPSVGWKKCGDFSEEAVIAAYSCMIEKFYPKHRVYMEGFRAYFRYAGPREAIFHAIIRRNLGCTHFIIGRDHAGVGGYYGKYEAQELAKGLMDKNQLGINLLLLKEPYFCKRCAQIVTEKHCKHKKDAIVSISGTEIREMLSKGKTPDERFMRSEVADIIIALGGNILIGEQDEK